LKKHLSALGFKQIKDGEIDTMSISGAYEPWMVIMRRPSLEFEPEASTLDAFS